MSRASYAIALRSNQPHHRHGGPGRILLAALQALEAEDIHVASRAHIIQTPPIGPSRRTFANSAALIQTNLHPPELLQCLKRIERDFGRRPGQRWGQRRLDIDIILWSGGRWNSRHLAIPHISFRERSFVLDPLAGIAPRWRDPATALTIRHLLSRLKKPKPVDRRAKPD
ncbi:MAG TPA: 2-amino-4-hydroxy-6-hydroxymethyldihydropteridine diphosphokinase [Rhizorhapis sp.]|nr:2-amino-4-hydroxy-6-hydroxymethyldihydropteridine diphosphokinase [Rhizorhapis sp.]